MNGNEQLAADASPRPPLLATRTMKARWPGTCAIDDCSIFRGDRIGLVDGLGWCRVRCIVRHNRETTTEEVNR